MAEIPNTSLLLKIWKPYVPALTIASCSLSVIGSIAIILSYCVWKNTRSISRLLLVFVALSDLVTASGYIMGSVLYLQMYWKAENGTGVLQLEETYPFNLSCTIQSAITTISNMWSFWWMAILALHLYLSAGYLQFQLSQKLLPYVAALATLVPVVVTTPALVTNWLGVGNGTASVCWCYIRLKSTHTAFYDVLEFVEGKLWEFLSFLIIFILLCHLKFKLRKYVSFCFVLPVLTGLAKCADCFVLVEYNSASPIRLSTA